MEHLLEAAGQRGVLEVRRAALIEVVDALTREDLGLCDPERTDTTQIARPLAWYRSRLERHFLPIGGGLFLRKPVDVTVWHLERA